MSAQVNKVTVKLTPSLLPLGVHHTQPTVPSTTTTKPDDTGSASASAPVSMADVAATTTESKPTAATDNLKPATDAHPDDKKDAEKPKTFPTEDEVVAAKMALEPVHAGSEFHGFETVTPSAPTHAIFDPAPEQDLVHENPRSDAVPTGDGLPDDIEDIENALADDPAGAGTVLPNGEAAPDVEKAAKEESTEGKVEKKVNEAKEAAATNPGQPVAAAPLGENGTNEVAGAAKKDEEGDTEMKNIPSETIAKASDPTQAKEGVKAAPAPAAAAGKKRKAEEYDEDDDNEAVNGQAKKAKTEQTNGDGAADGATSPVKRAPGRPKKTAADKVNKAARKILRPVGMTQRKTRSQGPA
ncbi:LOW QUALITY PROTEIN: hypothetical protein B0H65DRAFT_511269 [Neurospora tetraspora]|uniref:Uncharacterized protein n=1 Tax=Neurospora tetraspora TaxID=94610 RepID=A0AAE0J8K0_9PEZI|nr:LOW QUALITY PROTEIN: hypothetical protein B0H65DRAFT_511269 [Neurospora tetraspora]